MKLPPPDDTWTTPLPEKVPRPTYWPAVLALGSVLMMLGIVTTWVISVTGLVLFILALVGWIGEMRHEQREQS